MGALAERCAAYAKALHYQEIEFHASPVTASEALISINNKLDLPDSAVGILVIRLILITLLCVCAVRLFPITFHFKSETASTYRDISTPNHTRYHNNNNNRYTRNRITTSNCKSHGTRNYSGGNKHWRCMSRNQSSPTTTTTP